MELYVHVPFCKRKCRYCDFASWAEREDWIPAYVDAVLIRSAFSARRAGHTVHGDRLSGGRYALAAAARGADPAAAGRILSFSPGSGRGVYQRMQSRTLTAAWLEAAQAAGVNRLSMGMQAGQPHLLHMLGRIHTFTDVEASVKLARAAGIRNLNLDLMFGLPGQTLNDWAETLDMALSLHPEHLSCYGLIPEEGTQLGDAILAGEVHLPAEDAERAMYDMTLTRLAAAGFEQYEISNFAKPGCALSA